MLHASVVIVFFKSWLVGWLAGWLVGCLIAIRRKTSDHIMKSQQGQPFEGDMFFFLIRSTAVHN